MMESISANRKKYIPDNKPNITFRDEENETLMLTDTATSEDRNVITEKADNSIQYKYSAYGVLKNATPVIIGATKTISESFRKYLSNIPGKHEIEEL
jgi:hypothetical protein